MKRLLLYVGVAAVATLVLISAAACGGGGDAAAPSPIDTNASQQPVTLTVWHPWTVKSEKQGFATAVAPFETMYPWITLNIVTFPNSDEFDQTLIKNINAGTAPDVAISFAPDYVGKYAADGLWEDLKPYMDADSFDMSVFAPAALSYTSYQGKQVALPVLTDAYGLYYNKTMFAKAGLSDPPKTMSELMDYARKLTVRDQNGDIEIAGFVPLNAFNELGPSDLAHAWGAKWFDSSNKAILAGDPGWASAFTWQKQLVDWYGKDAITRFYATWVDKEWTPDQVFETGHVAMIWDGEWRTKMIANDKAAIDYDTAPFPAADDHPEMYGSGRAGGTICGIPRGAENADAAWLLVKYMSTDTDFLVALANMLGNVPTTTASAQSPDLKMPAQMQTFIDVWNNPSSLFQPPLQAVGATYADFLNNYNDKWVQGEGGDLQVGLQTVDQDIDNELTMGQAP
ncbi:MAG: extracellular solute-binding protein [Actinomycetes bacterium]